MLKMEGATALEGGSKGAQSEPRVGRVLGDDRCNFRPSPSICRAVMIYSVYHQSIAELLTDTKYKYRYIV